ncbi:metal ABC transporter ATP-binding protein [Moraxella atlantae]|uniref:Zinc import ATP-binding protein ZnuC n=2 Tax=Faucicola atlantae TaxID=34059 RepID=A0A378Q3K2_9GAMM|nr:ATP-binding cassette domain-containing protein [Moraxella atlantae]OPH34756.1 ABC transporter ATP-binding protein [Moraxella atlantae]STY95370.1 Zinc import ATP-binding protein ZnuC [Moraxella atlantae]
MNMPTPTLPTTLDFACQPTTSSTAPRDVLRLTDASMCFGERTLWQGVSFEVKSSEFVALIGANGAGKTTLLQSVLGLRPLSHGQVWLARDARIGYVPQLKNFDPRLPIRGRDLVQLGLDGGNLLFGWLSLTSRGSKPARRWWSAKQKQRLVDKAIAEVNGQAFCHAPLHLMSGGEQQRMRIAQALVNDPDLLLMDEPLLSLDVTSQQIVCDILAHRKAVHQTAVLMVSHEREIIAPLVDQVVYLSSHTTQVGGRKLLSQL